MQMEYQICRSGVESSMESLSLGTVMSCLVDERFWLRIFSCLFFTFIVKNRYIGKISLSTSISSLSSLKILEQKHLGAFSERGTITELHVASKYTQANIIIYYNQIDQINSMLANKESLAVQRCQSCSGLLQSLGSQSYCPSCCTLAPIIELELKIVPITYQSNSQDKRLADKEKRISDHIFQFSNQYRSISSLSEIKFLRDKTIQLLESKPSSRGLRETAAVIIFWECQYEHKLSIKDFCIKNQLALKSFHKKYILYKQIMRKRENCDLPAIKSEERLEVCKKQEQICSQDEIPVSNEIGQLWGSNISSESCEQNSKALELIFDEVFTKYYFQEHKHSIMRKLVMKMTGCESKLSEVFNCQSQNEVRSFYSIFVAIKEIGVKISIPKYMSIVEAKSGFHLKNKVLLKVLKIAKSLQEAQQEEIFSQDFATQYEDVKDEDSG